MRIRRLSDHEDLYPSQLLAELGLRSDDQVLLVRRDRLTVSACAVRSVLLGVRFPFPARGDWTLSSYLFPQKCKFRQLPVPHKLPRQRVASEVLKPHPPVFSQSQNVVEPK